MRVRSVILTVFLLGVSVAPLTAHHSVAGFYDTTKVVTITGVITDIVWRNPHSSVSMNVKETDGSISSWRVELAGLSNLTAVGFDRKFLDLTSSFTMEMWPARDGSRNAAGRILTLPDGRKFDVRDKFFSPALNFK